MITKEDIQVKVQEILEDWLVCKSMPVRVIISNNKTIRGGVSYGSKKDDFGFRVCDKSSLELEINERLLSSPAELERTIAHECWHIIQHNIMSSQERRSLIEETVEENRVTRYCPNMLELQAEVFAINLCGSSNHSYEGAKSDPLYREVLDCILNMC